MVAGQDDLTRENILSKTNDGLDIFDFYCKGYGFNATNLKKKFKYRNERTASASIKKMSSGAYVFSDFGDETGLSPFDFVIREFNISYFKALSKINEDLKLNLLPNKNNSTERLKISENPIDEKVVEYFKGRGIDLYTLLRFDVRSGVTSIFVKNQDKFLNRNTIQFNYFKKGRLVNIKYRDSEKNFKLEKGGELIFYGLDMIESYDWCIITEGEIDLLTYYQAGQYAVCSVPNGATKGKNNLQYLDNSYEWFENKKTIYLATDDDKPGDELANELARRLGKHRCKRVRFEGKKDVNELWLSCGKDKDLIAKGIETAEGFPIEGIVSEDELRNELRKLFLEGYPNVLRVGYRNLDRHFGFRTDKGEVTVITGTPNAGKSTFISQIIVRMLALHDWRCAIFSPENNPVGVNASKMMTQYSGKTFQLNTPNRLTEQEYELTENAIAKNVYYLRTSEENMNVEYLISKGIELVLQKGIRLFIVDPWNMIEHNRPANQTETEYIGKVLTKFSLFASNYNCHVVIVAHPTKISKGKDGNYEVPTLYNISGSANFFNKPDNGMCVWLDKNTGKVGVFIQKIRFQEFVGQKGVVEFEFEPETSRYKEISDYEYTSFLPEKMQFFKPSNLFNSDKFHEPSKSVFIDDEPPF